MARCFNLIDEKWILTSSGKVSLFDIFNDDVGSVGNLVGTPLEKISVFRFLLALIQRVWTPKNRDEWKSISLHDMRCMVKEYLNECYDLFWLYDEERPFLQVRSDYEKMLRFKPIHLFRIETSDNMVITSDLQQTPDDITNEEKVRLLLVALNFALAHKKWGDGRKVVPSAHTVGNGFVLVNLLGDSLLETLKFNMITREELDNLKMFPYGLGIAPWETDISFENEKELYRLRESYLGILVPLSRLVRFDFNSSNVWIGPGPVVYTNKEEEFDPFWLQIRDSNGNIIYKKTDVNKGIIKELPALVEYSNSSVRSFILDSNLGYIYHIASGEYFGMFIGGISFSSQSGGKYISGSDDLLDSTVKFPIEALSKEWLKSFKRDIEFVTELGERLYSSIKQYWLEMNRKNKQKKAIAERIAKKASGEFWKVVTAKLDTIIESSLRENLRERFCIELNNETVSLYNTFCPQDTSKQMKVWVKYAWFL